MNGAAYRMRRGRRKTGMRMAGMTGMRMGRRIAVATALACAAPSGGAELSLKALAPDRLRPQDLCKPMASLGNVHYLEIVTNERDASCQLLQSLLGLEFSEPVASLGNARTATRGDETQVGVRAPMHDQEKSVTRPYYLVPNLDAALETVKEGGGMLAWTDTMPGGDRAAIYFQGGVEYGLWQKKKE